MDDRSRGRLSTPDESLLQMFRAESAERLQRVVDVLLSVERGAVPENAFNTVLRDLHSIKGAAGMLELAAADSIAQAMEELFADARESGELAPEAVDPLLRASDALGNAVRAEDVDTEKILAELAELSGEASWPPASGA